MSLRLKNIRISDKGSYTCEVSFDDMYYDVLVDLQVAAKGGMPSIFLRRHVKQGIGLTCRAAGWFPKPEVIWLDGQGQIQTELLTTKVTKTPAGLYSVVTSMNLESGSDMEISCRIVNSLLNTTSESRVLISGRLKAELDFWEARSHAAALTVNPDCRVLELQVPGVSDVKSNVSEPTNASSTVPVLVGKEGFSAGKHYWEVEVGQQQDWVLGVMREKEKQEEEGILPGEDYWALHRSQGEIFSSEGHRRIEKQQSYSVIGVLLDLEEGQVSFYEAEQRAML
ncbi:PREDICTED: butyrophilin subfamily 3 member A3-like, partial [Mesitornis unicolor]|uniref:butyrophilin subfamily 3 member A3-like n=1 Tax=Mesitornis unicolor TaxID=54374 RepID=UPI0005289593